MAKPPSKKNGKDPASSDEMKPTIENLKKATQIPEVDPPEELLSFRTANEWLERAKVKPIPNMLFGELWYEYELCILFADTNLGKSILAVQIGDSISKGKAIEGMALEAHPQKVIYFDFELSEKQFENRYSIDYSDHYTFSDNFYRVEINKNTDFLKYPNFESYLNNELEKMIVNTKTKILIIDNLTYLQGETEKAKNALPLMQRLNALKFKYNLSLLILAHIPKRDLSKGITRNDLQGSKMLMNFADSSFSIGESHQDKHLRYLKQIKARSTLIIHDTENVYNCEIQKPSNFLKFVFIGLGNEAKHLKGYSQGARDKTIKKVKELIEQGMTQRNVAKELGISLGAVNKYSKL